MGIQKDCYPFIFPNIKGPNLVEEKDIEIYIKGSHKMTFSS